MQIIENKERNAILTTLDPIAVQKLRTLPGLFPGKDGNLKLSNYYCFASGNAMKGFGRRLMYHHAYEDVLEIDFNELLVDFPGKVRRDVDGFCETGNSYTERGRLMKGVSEHTYDKIRQDIPMLDLLGGRYINSYLNGSASFGAPIICTQETWDIYAKDLNFHDDAEHLPYLEELQEQEKRSNYLRPHTAFYWNSRLIRTKSEGTALAFDAFISLIARRGEMSRRRFDVQFEDLNPKAAIKEFEQFLRDNKEKVVEGIFLLAEEFQYE